MLRYILKRLLWLLPVVLGVTWLIFTIMYLIPGSPAASMLGSGATQEEIAQAEEMLGLNGTYPERLGRYMRNAFLHFDFGTSYQYGTRVTDDIMVRFPRTLMLAVASMLVSFFVGVPLGIVAATHQDQIWDRVAMIVAMFGVSMPSFWLAILLVLEFAVKHPIFPAYGIGGFQYYILPAIANSFGGIAGFARQTRSSVLECIRTDYVTTARAKGISEIRILFEHIIPNSLIPIITYAGTQFSGLLGGAIVIENVFTIPGLGTYMVQAINYRDYNAIQGSVIFSAITFSVVMLIVDVIYAYVDPRIKAQYESKQRSRKNVAAEA